MSSSSVGGPWSGTVTVSSGGGGGSGGSGMAATSIGLAGRSICGRGGGGGGGSPRNPTQSPIWKASAVGVARRIFPTFFVLKISLTWGLRSALRWNGRAPAGISSGPANGTTSPGAWNRLFTTVSTRGGSSISLSLVLAEYLCRFPLR